MTTDSWDARRGMLLTLARAVHLFTVLAMASIATAQVGLRDAGTYATGLVDDACCVLVDGSGTIFVAGASSTVGATTGSAYITAWSASGSPLWTSTYDASAGGPERPSAIAFDGAGGLYVAGSAANAGLSQWRAFLLRVNATGAVTWAIERPMTAPPEWAPALLVDANGRAILGGRAPSNSGDLSIAAFRTTGALDWEATHSSGFSAPDQIADLAFAPNGDIVGAGTISLTNGPHPIVLRVTPTGQVVHATNIWNAEVTSGTAVSVVVDGGDRTFVASSSTGSSGALTALTITALDAQGAYLWTRRITGPQQSFGGGAGATDMVLDPFGHPLVLGWRAQGSQGVATVVVAHDRDGNEA